MTQKDLIAGMAEKSGLTKTDAEKALKALTETVTFAMQQGDEVALPGFGKFCVGDRSARTGKNPQTGEAMQIPACKVPKFKPGKPLKDAVNN